MVMASDGIDWMVDTTVDSAKRFFDNPGQWYVDQYVPEGVKEPWQEGNRWEAASYGITGLATGAASGAAINKLDGLTNTSVTKDIFDTDLIGQNNSKFERTSQNPSHNYSGVLSYSYEDLNGFGESASNWRPGSSNDFMQNLGINRSMSDADLQIAEDYDLQMSSDNNLFPDDFFNHHKIIQDDTINPIDSSAQNDHVNNIDPSGKTHNVLTTNHPLDYNRVGKTFEGGSYIEKVTTEDTTLYRTWGGQARPVGPYWTRIEPAGPTQAVIDSALDPSWGNNSINVTKITVPSGVTIYEGTTAPQQGLVGGGSQVYIPKVDIQWVDSLDYHHRHTLPDD
jgi:hypothetical protein